MKIQFRPAKHRPIRHRGIELNYWMAIIGYFSLGTLAYTYLVFPLVTLLRGLIFKRTWTQDDSAPPVSLIIVCHNEEYGSQAKLENVACCNYPTNSLEIIVASDGSDDRTAEIVKAFPDKRVKLFEMERRGKIPTLNHAVEHATGEILVFTDANSVLRDDALRKLTRHFADENIGCVAGNQVYVKDTRQLDEKTADRWEDGETSYWNLDRMLKQAQTNAGNAIAATGALYAIRARLFQKVPEGVTDDFYISTRSIQQGYQLIFDREAIAYEAVVKKSTVELGRKVRIMTRGMRSLLFSLDLMNPFRYGFYAIQLISHKLLKRLCVLPLLVLIFMTPWLFQWNFFFKGLSFLIWGGLLMTLFSLATSRIWIGKTKPCRILSFFALVNFAALLAILNILSGKKIDMWQPTGNR